MSAPSRITHRSPPPRPASDDGPPPLRLLPGPRRPRPHPAPPAAISIAPSVREGGLRALVAVTSVARHETPPPPPSSFPPPCQNHEWSNLFAPSTNPNRQHRPNL